MLKQALLFVVKAGLLLQLTEGRSDGERECVRAENFIADGCNSHRKLDREQRTSAVATLYRFAGYQRRLSKI